MTTYSKPLPRPDAVTEEFWKAAKRHELVIQHCKDCKEHIFYPREVCPRCVSRNLEWVKASGKGEVYSYTVVRKAAYPGFVNDVPYVYAIIELAEGVRMTSNVVGCNVEHVKVGMPVVVTFDDVTDDIALVKFKPA